MEKLNMDRQVCNIVTRYSPQYVRKRVLRTTADTLAVVVSGCSSALGLDLGLLWWLEGVKGETGRL